MSEQTEDLTPDTRLGRSRRRAAAAALVALALLGATGCGDDDGEPRDDGVVEEPDTGVEPEVENPDAGVGEDSNSSDEGGR